MFQPKNRNVKNTYKYNKYSRDGCSLSKSISRDDPQERVTNQPALKPHKGGKNGNENLLKKSLKTSQRKALQDSEQIDKPKRDYEPDYYASQSNSNILRYLDPEPRGQGYQYFEGGERAVMDPRANFLYQEPYVQNEPIHQGGGHYAPAPTFKNRFKGNDIHAFYMDRFQHITPRNGPGLAISPNTRLALNQPNRSRSVHLEEKGQLLIETPASIFKRNDPQMSCRTDQEWPDFGNDQDFIDGPPQGGQQPAHTASKFKGKGKYYTENEYYPQSLHKDGPSSQFGKGPESSSQVSHSQTDSRFI